MDKRRTMVGIVVYLLLLVFIAAVQSSYGCTETGIMTDRLTPDCAATPDADVHRSQGMFAQLIDSRLISTLKEFGGNRQ